jgi:hypothetical protein
MVTESLNNDRVLELMPGPEGKFSASKITDGSTSKK